MRQGEALIELQCKPIHIITIGEVLLEANRRLAIILKRMIMPQCNS